MNSDAVWVACRFEVTRKEEGDSFGRIGAIGEIDTGGGRESGAKLKKKAPRKILELANHSPTVSGEFCKASDIRNVIVAKANSLKYCFEKELQTKPSLKGKVVAQWTIDQTGEVQKASIASSTMGDKSVEGCVVRVVKKMRFAKPNGGGLCVVQYPFVFTGLE